MRDDGTEHSSYVASYKGDCQLFTLTAVSPRLGHHVSEVAHQSRSEVVMKTDKNKVFMRTDKI